MYVLWSDFDDDFMLFDSLEKMLDVFLDLVVIFLVFFGMELDGFLVVEVGWVLFLGCVELFRDVVVEVIFFFFCLII